MTQKELLYMEDAIGHMKNLASLSDCFAKDVEDQKLSDSLAKLAKKNQHLEEKLMKVMEEIQDEG